MARSRRTSSSSRPAARPAAPSKPNFTGRPSYSTSSSAARTQAPPTSKAPPPAPQQKTAPPPAAQQAPAAGGGGMGMMGNIASTAAGVAAGSVVGHGISNAIWGGRGEGAPAEAQQQQAPASAVGGVCHWEREEFANCMKQNDNNISACQPFIEMLKQCQETNQPQM